MSEDIDIRLKSLLAAPERAPDDEFASRVSRAVLAEERMRRSSRTAWTHFAVEMAATASAVLAFVLLARIGPPAESTDFIPVFSPAAAGLVLIALWVGVSLRPSEARF
jgi:hypothetical protein